MTVTSATCRQPQPGTANGDFCASGAHEPEAVFDPAKLAQGNRSGRKLMQAYFRQRGVKVAFSG